MAVDDLRGFIQLLEKNRELIRVKKRVDVKFELSDICRKVQDTRGPAILFENVRSYTGWRIAAGILGTPERIALALESSIDKMVGESIRRLDNGPVKPKIVSRSKAPCKEVVMERPDLRKIPVPVWHTRDGGSYITFSLQTTKTETGMRDVGIIRQMIVGPREARILLLPGKTIYANYVKRQARKEPLEIAVATGLEPLTNLVGVYPGRYDEDDFTVAGALRGRAVELVKCETVDIEVPATSEVVIEGRILPVGKKAEGPFGEFTGYYGPPGSANVMEVTCITHRRDPIWQGTCEGKPPSEDASVRGFMYSLGTLREASRADPFLTSVNMTEMGCCLLHSIASIRKNSPGQAKHTMNAIWSTKMGKYIKILIVVDEEVNVNNPSEVEYAIATNYQPDRDSMLITRSLGMPLDPSSWPHPVTSKLGIDATSKLPDEGLPKRPIKIDHMESRYYREIEKKGLEKFLNQSK